MNNVNDVVEYVMNTPIDTNPNVLRDLLSQVSILPATTISDNGQVLTVVNGNWDKSKLSYVTPEQFGAIGDGVTDDTAAIQAAIDTHQPVLFGYGKTYIVLSFTLYNGCKLYGNGATLKRPNLKNPPYNYTDEQIKWLRMFPMGSLGSNVDNLQIEFRDLTIDFNAFEMWEYTDTDADYKYEQGIGLYCAGSATHHRKILIDNCIFLNNYTSNITIANYVDIVITNSKSINCFKGICTIVGSGINVQISNCYCNSDYDFKAFWYEPNDAAQLKWYEHPDDKEKTPHDNPTDNYAVVNINNCIFYGKLSGITNTWGHFSINNTFIQGSEIYFAPRSPHVVELNQVSFVSINSVNKPFINFRGYGRILVNNCSFTSAYLIDEQRSIDLTSYKKGIEFGTTSGDPVTVIIIFNNCIFQKFTYAFMFSYSYSKAKQTISFNHCIFKDITQQLFGHYPGYSAAYFKSCSFSNCLFDVEVPIFDTYNVYEDKITFSGNDFINSNNRGFVGAFNGNGSNLLVFKDEMWSVPVAVDSGYRCAGKRTILVQEPPTFAGVNGVDFAELTVSPYTRYKYINNQWEEIE